MIPGFAPFAPLWPGSMTTTLPPLICAGAGAGAGAAGSSVCTKSSAGSSICGGSAGSGAGGGSGVLSSVVGSGAGGSVVGGTVDDSAVGLGALAGQPGNGHRRTGWGGG